jgi:hypothetical protein
MNVESMHAACLNVYKYAPATCHNADILTFVHNFQKVTMYATRWKVADSIPDEVIGFFN